MLAAMRGERGQALILFVGAFTVILVVAAIVIDFGLWMAERRSMQRAADLAAAAGAQELFIERNWATIDTDVKAYARNNGYEDGFDGVTVTVEPLCRNQLATPPDGICTTAPGAASSDCIPDPVFADCDSLRVTISKPASRLFTSIFGISTDISAAAAAGVQFGGGGTGGGGGAVQQTVILLDAQGRMGNLCGTYPDECPMTLARNEAHGLTDLLLDGDGLRQVGFAAFTYCYEGPPNYPLPSGPNNPCVPVDEITPLTDDEALLHVDIAATHAHSSGVANVCLPLLEAVKMFVAQPTTLSRAVVLLTDGDNRYNHNTYFESRGYPPPECRPAPYDETQPPRYGACESPVPEELRLDLLTIQVANDLKALGAEIYVVAYNVCGPEDGNSIDSPGYCNAIGLDNAHDNIANQRLLKCVATSPEHYFPVTSPELPGTFRDVALELSNRGLLQ